MAKADLLTVFLQLQKKMVAELEMTSKTVDHPGAKGTGTELNWLRMFGTYLPHRYRVTKGFALDCEGKKSEEIDILIYDRQYSPILMDESGVVYITAESVYAVIEVKPTFSKAYVEYAGQKAASVRALKRTSTHIPNIYGTAPPVPPRPILAGIVALKSKWRPPMGNPLETALRSLDHNSRIDLGCALRHGSFEARLSDDNVLDIHRSEPDHALMFFYLRLLARLQSLGTAPAIDFNLYGKALQEPPAHAL